MEEITLAVIGDFVTKLGATGVLIVGLWAFLRGFVWPKNMVEKTLEAQQKAAEQSAIIIAKTINEELSNGVKKGMVEGIAEGYLKINDRHT
jgi:hypothetical protein